MKIVKSALRILLVLVLFGMTQILPFSNYAKEPEVKLVVITAKNRSLQEQIYKVLPSCVYVETEEDYNDWNGETITRKRSGSGVIVSEDGLIVTAGHMVDRATKITVILNDGRKFVATDFSKEDSVDLGLIKIDVRGLSAAQVGNSDNEFLGNSVFIIGSPFGKTYFNTVTAGIVSGLKRDIAFFGEKLMIQVDSSAWPGNSGGGLFNSGGELVGILVGNMYRYDNMSLCAPSNIVKLLVDKYNSERDMAEAR